MKSPCITLYGIPNCDTVKKSRAWMTEHGLQYEFHDFKKQGVPAEHLAEWTQALGWQKLLNRQGTTWRKLDPDIQAAVPDDATARATMQNHPSTIKRPVVEWPVAGHTELQICVGFAPEQWLALMAMPRHD